MSGRGMFGRCETPKLFLYRKYARQLLKDGLLKEINIIKNKTF